MGREKLTEFQLLIWSNATKQSSGVSGIKNLSGISIEPGW